MNYKSIIKLLLITLFSGLINLTVMSQNLNNIRKNPPSEKINTITKNISFNGYTSYWQDNYSTWHRYGNLFKISVPNISPTILQSKVDVSEDMGLPGLLMQEGFISRLYASDYKIIENPTLSEIENLEVAGNTLVLIDSDSEAGKQLNLAGSEILKWADKLPSHQFKSPDLEIIKAFYIEKGGNTLFVITSSHKEQVDLLMNLIQETRLILDKYKMQKGWFGSYTLYNSVTITPGHPLQLIGHGMNEGNSWFVFDGYMEFLSKDDFEKWVDKINYPLVLDMGISGGNASIYGCSDYEDYQIQDMSVQQTIDFAKEKGGFVFGRVYDPVNEDLEFDGHIAIEGNKEQIDNEDVPFVLRTGSLNGGMTSSMVLFIEKEKPFTRETLWEAILNRDEVAVLEQAKMMGPAKYRNALQLLYLDKIYLEDYFNDNLDIQTKVEGYDLYIKLTNYSSRPISGSVEVSAPSINIDDNILDNIIINGNDTKFLKIPLKPQKEAMGVANPITINYTWDNNKKATIEMLELPPAISMNQILYSHAPQVSFPVTIHNFTEQTSFPVEVIITEKEGPNKVVLKKSEKCEINTGTFDDVDFQLKLSPGNYWVQVNALGTSSKSQLGVGKANGKPVLYELDLDGDGINEYRMENDSVQVTLLRTGARVIEYIIKSKEDNVLFKSWPNKPDDHRSPHRMRRYYPYGGFEDFLGQASMETHHIFDAKITRSEGDYVQVEMETDFYGNHMKKIFTLFGNSPLLEVKYELVFTNPEANVLGPQPILALGEAHGPEDVFTAPTTKGHKEYIMRMEENYGQAIELAEGWNAGYDTTEDLSFIGAFPVSQPIFLHMWMNTPTNTDTRHYYVEFQPWTPIIQKSKMYFSYYMWGSAGHWQNSLDELENRNLISYRNRD